MVVEEIGALKRENVEEEIEAIKDDADFDNFIACLIAQRVANRDCRFNRYEIALAAEEIKPKVKQRVNVEFIRLILSPDSLACHDLHVRRRGPKKSWLIVRTDGICMKIRAVLKNFYPDNIPRKFVRQRVTGCVLLIQWIVNENEDFFLSDD